MEDHIKLAIGLQKLKEGNLYLILDLERSFQSGGQMYFWKGNRHGYTQVVSEAGLFDEPVAKRLVEEDVDQRTVMIPALVAEKILKQSNEDGFTMTIQDQNGLFEKLIKETK